MIHLIHPDHQNNITQVTSKNSQQGRNVPTIILSFARIDPRGIVWLYQYITHTLPSSGQEQNDMSRSDLICAETALCLIGIHIPVFRQETENTHILFGSDLSSSFSQLFDALSLSLLSLTLFIFTASIIRVPAAGIGLMCSRRLRPSLSLSYFLSPRT